MLCGTTLRVVFSSSSRFRDAQSAILPLFPNLFLFLFLSCSLVLVALRATLTGSAAAPPPQLSEEKKAAIVRQVEYYFSDENLPSDKFMKQKLKAGGPQGTEERGRGCGLGKHDAGARFGLAG